MIIGIHGKKQHGKDTVTRIIQYVTKNQPHSISIESFLNKDYPIDIDAGITWKRKIFAGKLKETVALLIGCSIQDLENEEFKNKPLGYEWIRYRVFIKDWMFDVWNSDRVFISESDATNYIETLSSECKIERQRLTPRVILQELGTEGMRSIHPNFHVNALFADYKVIDWTDGWMPTYNNPDNAGCAPVAEPIYPNWIIADVRFPNEVEAIRKLGGLVIKVENPRIQSNDNHPSEISLDDYKNWDWQILNDGTLLDLENKVRDFLYTKTLI